MRWRYLKRFFLAYVFCVPVALSQESIKLTELPVTWLPAEQWQWQGQELSSQRFQSQHDVATLAQHIQKQLPTVDLRVQRLASSWLLSFDHQATGTHYLFLLSAQVQGTAGWLSTMKLIETKGQPVALVPPVVFAGLYAHSWSSGNLAMAVTTRQEPFYSLLQPVNASQRLWQQINTRLIQQAWVGGYCAMGQWCQWHKNTQKLWLWVDPKLGLWHVLWWPQGRGE